MKPAEVLHHRRSCFYILLFLLLETRWILALAKGHMKHPLTQTLWPYPFCVIKALKLLFNNFFLLTCSALGTSSAMDNQSTVVFHPFSQDLNAESRHHPQSLHSSNAPPTAFHSSSSRLGTLFLNHFHTSLQRAEEGANTNLCPRQQTLLQHTRRHNRCSRTFVLFFLCSSSHCSEDFGVFDLKWRLNLRQLNQKKKKTYITCWKILTF